MDASTLMFFVVGLGLLVVGGNWLVDGASDLAYGLRISPLVVGLTVVAFGTSAPEMAVSALSSLKGQGDIAVGNVVGSNLFNVMFVLGSTALIYPLAISRKVITVETPVMLASAVLAFVLALDQHLSWINGIVLIAGLFIYLFFLVKNAKSDSADPALSNKRSAWWNISLVIVGLATLVLGSNWFVEGAIHIARFFDVDERVIGLTIVAGGTSLPEVAASVIAALKGERDMAVGNVLGSNVFNSLGVLGLAGVVSPAGVTVDSSMLYFDFPLMLIMSAICIPFFVTGAILSRREAAILLISYVTYTIYLVFEEIKSDYFRHISFFAIWILIPLVAIYMALSLATHFGVLRRR